MAVDLLLSFHPLPSISAQDSVVIVSAFIISVPSRFLLLTACTATSTPATQPRGSVQSYPRLFRIAEWGEFAGYCHAQPKPFAGVELPSFHAYPSAEGATPNQLAHVKRGVPPTDLHDHTQQTPSRLRRTLRMFESGLLDCRLLLGPTPQSVFRCVCRCCSTAPTRPHADNPQLINSS